MRSILLGVNMDRMRNDNLPVAKRRVRTSFSILENFILSKKSDFDFVKEKSLQPKKYFWLFFEFKTNLVSFLDPTFRFRSQKMKKPHCASAGRSELVRLPLFDFRSTT